MASYNNLRYLRALEELHRCSDPIGVDVETAGTDPLTVDLLCVGVACESVGALSMPWPLDPEVFESLRLLLASDRPKVLQNAQHDLLSLERFGLPLKGIIYDTMLAHATCAPQLPHDLGFIAACESTAPRWKTEFRVETDLKGAAAFTRRDPTELRTYNAKDAYMTAWLWPRLEEQCKAMHKGADILKEYHELADVALRMRKYGVKVDKSVFDEHRTQLRARMADAARRFKNLRPAGIKLGKSGQHPSLRKLFFEHLKAEPLRYSEETMQPVLDKTTLESYLGDPRLAPYVQPILDFRKSSKLVSTYIDGLPVHDDDRVRPTWKIYGTVTGRWSSQEPNAQNIPKVMRNIYVPSPGMHLVACDMSQLELRIMALLSGAPKLLEWYNQGVDVHRKNAEAIRGTKNITDQDRKFAKIFAYALLYGADSEKIWTSLKPQFPDLKLLAVAQARKAFFKEHPEIVTYQKELLAQANSTGFVEESVSGRREYFHSGLIEPNKVLNFPIQGFAGSLMNKAILAVDKEIDWGREGILFQVHDEIVVEGPNLKRLIELMREKMTLNISHNGNTMKFTCDIETGPNWRDIKEC